MRKILLALSAVAATFTSVNAQQRVPLFEVFTSSTCPPCNPGNTIYENVLVGKPTSEYVSIKYQQNFPSTGDPYCTTEGVNRRTTPYAINSIPRMEIDGGWDQNAQSFTQALYTSSRSVPAKFNISGTFYIKDKTITAKIKYSPLAVPTGAKLFVAITESVDSANKKTNGETKFYNVMKKMLPDEFGTLLPTIAVGVYDSTTQVFTFNGAYRLPLDGQTANRINNATEYSVENFANLKVVAWVQGSNKEVYNAANLAKVTPPNPAAVGGISNTLTSVSVYPNPAANTLNLDFNMKESDNVTAKLYDMRGAVVATKSASFAAGTAHMSFETLSLANGIYNLVVLDSKNNSFGQRVTIAH